MSEIRKDPLSGTWVILATERGKRPSDFSEAQKPGGSSKVPAKPARPCPFCGTGAEMTIEIPDHEIWPGEFDEVAKCWRTRVLPNLYPALAPKIELTQSRVDHIYHMLSGVGGHEVIVDSPHHDDGLFRISQDQMESVIRTYMQRFKYWHADPRMSYVLIFKNWGVAAGASLEHTHSQVVATPIIPTRVYEELEEARDYYDREDECIYCRMIQDEAGHQDGRRVVENATMMAMCPFAARSPFELKIMPKRHMSAFEHMSPAEVTDLAAVMREVGQRMYALVGDVPYNYMLHVAPMKTPGLLYYHWHIEMIPRLTVPAGFEWGTAMYINVLSPEDSAKGLREVDISAVEPRPDAKGKAGSRNSGKRG